MNFLKRQVHGSEDPDELGPLPWVKVNTQQLPNHLPPPQCFGPHPFYRLPPKHLRTASSLSTYNLSGLLNLAQGLTQLAWDSAPQRSFERNWTQCTCSWRGRSVDRCITLGDGG